ncbi:MAG: aspartate kinase [Anaerolineales bacterium]
MGTLVMKFGGTSVGSVEALTSAVDIVMQYKDEWQRLVVVVSAMAGVTNALIEAARSAERGDAERYKQIHTELLERHGDVIETLVKSAEVRQSLLAQVEEMLEGFANARVVAALLRERSAESEAVDATQLIVTDDRFQDAVPKREVTCKLVRKHLEPLLKKGLIPVVTGFIAATEDGATTPLGRGGSDYTAAILGDCLDADEVWTWTDVDGVMSADPRLVAGARVIPKLSYNEVSELAYFGARVLHPKTIRPIVERGIPLWVKNTFNPEVPGTLVVADPKNGNGNIKAVTAIENLSMITVQGMGMLGVPGIAARTFAAVARQGVSVLMISQASSEQSICFIIPMEAVAQVMAAVEDELAVELARRDVDKVWSMDDVVIVSAVGAGLRSTPGIAARIFGALGRAQINVVAIAQGSSECSLSFLVGAGDAAQAVQSIHEEVIVNG